MHWSCPNSVQDFSKASLVIFSSVFYDFLTHLRILNHIHHSFFTLINYAFFPDSSYICFLSTRIFSFSRLSPTSWFVSFASFMSNFQFPSLSSWFIPSCCHCLRKSKKTHHRNISNFHTLIFSRICSFVLAELEFEAWESIFILYGYLKLFFCLSRVHRCRVDYLRNHSLLMSSFHVFFCS